MKANMRASHGKSESRARGNLLSAGLTSEILARSGFIFLLSEERFSIMPAQARGGHACVAAAGIMAALVSTS